MSSADAFISVRDVHKHYKAGWKRSVHALKGVSLEVMPGQIFGLLGPNGAGKTTLIKVVLGIIRRSGGNVSLMGHPAGDLRGRQMVGYLPENLRVAHHQSARTAMEYYGRLSRMSFHEIREKRDKLLDLVGLSGRTKESVKRFSKGMLQRLGLAQSLLHDPKLLILDEPTDGLDPVGRAQVRNILFELRDQGRTIFLNSHLLHEVESVCDHVAILGQGELKFQGQISELTPSTTGNLLIEIAGTESAIRELLGNRQISSMQPRHDSVEAILPMADDTAANALVDQIRAGGFSIRKLDWRRKTLEDAFLELVGTPEETLGGTGMPGPTQPPAPIVEARLA